MTYRIREARIEDLLPLRVYNVQQRSGASESQRAPPRKGYEVKEDVEEVEVDVDTSEYDEAMDEIDNLVADQEQAEKYVQKTGQ